MRRYCTAYCQCSNPRVHPHMPTLLRSALCVLCEDARNNENAAFLRTTGGAQSRPTVITAAAFPQWVPVHVFLFGRGREPKQSSRSRCVSRRGVIRG
ncbi:hypothetical protein EVAR_63358_1 [Eumeta japonica]|uniref:Uncharacterized protein n=1 Tax=Eumeta variegata TaxID=151549 RepID=A0A4C2ADD5_EUMVA|nr:hypothetical protein EVAR_63358_1 [Eumeta japonica]